jgi:rubrerythrin
MSDTSTAKPSYLGLLNAISVAEAEAEGYLGCWADVTPRDDVRQVLRTVALREGEHAKAFAKRICELGFEVRPGEADPDKAAIAASTTLTDREKFEKLGLGREPGDGPDVFAGMFADSTIDIQTGGLLGRYIAEERDSGRMFRACYQALCADEPDGTAASADDLAAVNERLDRIEAAIAKLAKPASRKKK